MHIRFFERAGKNSRIASRSCHAALAAFVFWGGRTAPIMSIESMWEIYCRYFPANFAHALLGLQEGCTYITGYNVGGFDDAVDSLGLSNWLATAQPAIVAQVRATSHLCTPLLQPSCIPSGNLNALSFSSLLSNALMPAKHRTRPNNSSFSNVILLVVCLA